MLCLHIVLALISTVYCSSYSAEHEKRLSLTKCKFKWIKNEQQPSTSMLAFTASLNKTDNNFILTLSNGKQYYNHPLSKQECDLFLMQYVKLKMYHRSLYFYGTLDDQPISIAMQNPRCKISSSFNKNHTKASIGLHLREQTPASSYEMIIKNNFELPLFAQNKIYSIYATKHMRHNLTTKRDDFWTHYLCFNFIFYYKGQRQKNFRFECYVSTVRTLDKKVIISDPYFYIAKEKILLLLQAVQHIESSVESNYNA